MTLTGICVLAALGAVSQAGQADLPVDGAALGRLEAVLEHCEWASPEGSEHYKAVGKVLTRGATDKGLAEVRSGAEYRDAYDAMNDQWASCQRKRRRRRARKGSCRQRSDGERHDPEGAIEDLTGNGAAAAVLGGSSTRGG